jgi:polyisoprenoid-binding protein YceI
MIRKFSILLMAAAIFGITLTQASTWTADPAHSNVGFKVKHMMVSNVHGSFGKFDVTVNYDEKDVTKSSVNVTIDPASINTGVEKRDNHLRSADFFDVAKFPQLTFVSKRVEKEGENLRIVGDLTMHGVTKEVALKVTELNPPITDPMGGVRMGASASARINRTDYGLLWNKAIEAGGVVVGERVDILIEVELMKLIEK